MQRFTSILVVAGRCGADRALLARAVLLARNMGAQIHLFSCDSQLARTLRQNYSSEDAEKAWDACVSDHVQYLQSLKGTVGAPDIRITVDAACHSSLQEGLLEKIAAVNPDLVMKSPSGTHPLRRFSFDANDWLLMRTCPVTLMLVRAHEWRPVPTFAALVNVFDESTTRLGGSIVHTAEYFSLGCHGELDLVYSEPSDVEATRQERARRLDGLAHEYRIGAAHVHALSGDPHTTLSDFAARRQYDALVLGALTHRKGLAAAVGTLTSQLADCLGCDLILVKPDFTKRVAEIGCRETDADDAPSRVPHRSGSSVLWQSLFGD